MVGDQVEEAVALNVGLAVGDQVDVNEGDDVAVWVAVGVSVGQTKGQ